MNRIQSRCARRKISGKGYCESRRVVMVALSLVYEKLAAHTFPARDGKQYAYYCAMVERYRKRAAWYVKKNRNEK